MSTPTTNVKRGRGGVDMGGRHIRGRRIEWCIVARQSGRRAAGPHFGMRLRVAAQESRDHIDINPTCSSGALRPGTTRLMFAD